MNQAINIQSSKNCLLVLEKVSRRFGGLQAVSDVTLAVQKGEVVGIIGPNGSGKTTLFNLITGIYPISKGRILFNGQELAGLPSHKIASMGIGRTFQSPRVFDNLTVIQHAIVAMKHTQKKPTLGNMLKQLWTPWMTHMDFARGVLDRIGMNGVEKRLAAHLPYGNRRLLEIASQLAAEPSLLLLDEPTAGLNTDEREHLEEILALLAMDQGLTMVIIEHDIRFVQKLCSRVIVLNNGSLICGGIPENILSDPRVIAAYLGEHEPCSW